MSNNIFGSGDPWENGWATNDKESHDAKSPTIPGFGSESTYLTSSQLLKNNNTGESILSNIEIPASYKEVYTALSEDITSVTDLENVFNRLIETDHLTRYQSTKLLNALYDHDILPLSNELNFYQILGLLALELDVAGSGDYVTLQFKLKSLPELPRNIVQILTKKDNKYERSRDFVDPLSAELANSSLTDRDDVNWDTNISEPNTLGQDKSVLSDPILVDHALVQKKQGESNENQHPIDHSHITKYINDIRDAFTPLVDTKDSIKIKEVPEKEGLVFKHINYIITHDLHLGMHGPAGSKKVIRRYSDFVWYVL